MICSRLMRICLLRRCLRREKYIYIIPSTRHSKFIPRCKPREAIYLPQIYKKYIMRCLIVQDTSFLCAFTDNPRKVVSKIVRHFVTIYKKCHKIDYMVDIGIAPKYNAPINPANIFVSWHPNYVNRRRR